jgi:hypothetical protein
MNIQENVTIYRCDFCNRRFLSKSGCKSHEEKYCKNENNPRIKNCEHKNVDTIWQPICGEEFRQEPAYDQCADCGKKF